MRLLVLLAPDVDDDLVVLVQAEGGADPGPALGRGPTQALRVAPAFDDAFARELGDFDSLDALKRAITEDLQRDAEREADAKVRAELEQKLKALGGR